MTKDIPEAIKDRLAKSAAAFKQKYNVEHDDLTDFMMDIIGIISDYYDEESPLISHHLEPERRTCNDCGEKFSDIELYCADSSFTIATCTVHTLNASTKQECDEVYCAECFNKEAN